jgi:hypothetical protein
LPGVNLTGRIIPLSATYTSGASVTVMKYNPNWRSWQHFGSRWSNGEFGFKLEPGTYRVTVELGNGNSQTYANSYVENCVVPTSGSVTCNVTLQAPNLFGKITNSSGQIFRQAYAQLFIITDDKAEGNRRFDQNVRIDEGYFSTRINDGNYLLSVNPYWEARLDNSPREYSVKVVNELGVNCKFELEETNNISLLEPNAGIYFLSFKMDERTHFFKIIIL